MWDMASNQFHEITSANQTILFSQLLRQDSNHASPIKSWSECLTATAKHQRHHIHRGQPLSEREITHHATRDICHRGRRALEGFSAGGDDDSNLEGNLGSAVVRFQAAGCPPSQILGSLRRQLHAKSTTL